MDPDGVCALVVVENGTVEVVLGDRDALMVEVVVVVVCREVLRGRTGMVVFHW